MSKSRCKLLPFALNALALVCPCCLVEVFCQNVAWPNVLAEKTFVNKL